MIKSKKIRSKNKNAKMPGCWESREDKLKRWMSISPKKKLEWLYEMQKLAKALPPEQKRLRLKLRRQK